MTEKHRKGTHANNVNDIEPIVSEIKIYASDNTSDAGPPLKGWAKFVDSFREGHGQHLKEKNLKMSHLMVIALSSGLGTGLLVGSAAKLRLGGPLAVLLAYAIVGAMCICTMNSVGELTVAYTEMEGGFNEFYRMFLDDSIAFALGWNYWFEWVTTISLELVTASMTIKYWNTSINSDVFVVIFFLVICFINLFGVRGYGEAEFFMNSLKLTMLTGFFIMGLCIDFGATKSGYIGGKYWRHPGAWVSFKGFVKGFSTASFSMGGTEFLALSVSEVRNPRAALPTAIRLVFLRIVFFYLGSLVIVGLLVPYDSDRLLGSGSVSASPYVLAADLHGVKVVPHIVNAVILNSVTSVATAAMYSSSRLLRSLAEQGYAPRFFNYTDKAGRPLRAWIVSILASCFAFIATYEKQDVVFNWLLSIVALSIVFIWPALCICHLRWRAALAYNNVSLDTLGFVSYTGVLGSWYSIIVNGLILIGQFWVALFPDGDASVNNFFQNYACVPFLIVCYLGHKIYVGNWKKYWLRVDEIDIFTGRTIYDPEIMKLEKEEAKQKYAAAPWWKKAYLWI
ncbi:putative general amino acid permease [Clavispora lusitaniae]|uniref:Amino acid permease/ SLC12A domain-containing protein n=3 Tax=Clavispora lusitaniae TaxID=36911 RepID=C4Y7G1_CLAL4|nr:uncharacterized protein CLUG_04139 [Clavispora lusitaniae ATCC 42720]KAF5209975.1 amino acid transporter [Clavispora lusitaniae]EEQ40011.1 hypothetical protein CLUG_04139 [Clavispora lusitaniae ATCC 42720]OVF09871.1 putative amino acid transporter [Clavispora lusitaniae]QFZ29455.1 putative general amino acid permease [Clavispora lusitaniae]QFZ35118.1 putative general amino acid permease [Clavispora lusitaniae]